MLKLTKKQKLEIEEVAQKYDLKLILLFGSQASGKTHKKSDADIALIFDEKKRKDLPLDDQLSIFAALSRVIIKNLDISVVNHANPLLLKQIYFSSQLLFGSEKDYYNFRLYAFNRFNDYAPYFVREAELASYLVKQM